MIARTASALLLSALTACSQPPSADVRDVDRYLAALSADDPAAGFAQCADLSTASLRGDCQSDLSERLLQPDSTMAEVTTICDTIEQPAWRHECWFMAADIRQVTGPMVWAACEQTGRYRSFCFDHALQRELAAVVLPLGAEDDAQKQILALLEMYFPDERDALLQERFNRSLAYRVGARWRSGDDFDPMLCSPLNGPLCRFSYLHSVSNDDVDIAAICAAPEQTPAVVEQHGGYGWTEAGAELAEQVWSDLCRSRRSPRRGPSPLPRRHLLPLPR